METLTVVARHQSYDNRRMDIPDVLQFSPSRTLKGLNCRAYESKTGIPPSPSQSFINFGSPGMSGQKMTLPLYPDPVKECTRSNPISIRSTPTLKLAPFKDDQCDTELWAGPAYSNSPPPSSLPMPNFSLCRRSESFEAHRHKFQISDLRPVKSVPSSPEKQSYLSSAEFFTGTNPATKGLRRMLNLET